MSTPTLPPLLAGMHEIKRNWGWFLVLGVILIILGVVALGMPYAITGFTVIMFGWLFLIEGVVEIFSSFSARGFSGFLLHLLEGILYCVIGGALVLNPGIGALAITLMLAILFLISGIFQIAAAASLRFPNWGWVAFSGFISAVLGIMVWNRWPDDSV
jgi:uncharacterized membrane protein HdeD (DUF308 family)